MAEKYDFSGWATRNNIRCADGRVIRYNAFIDNDGSTVPLVWQHQHNDPKNVLGHALLENREEGVYAYCSLNDTPMADNTRTQIQHGDITNLSIYANHLEERNANVLHGAIREVSLVLAGANPGALIDVPFIQHGDEGADEAIIYTDENLELYHSDDDEYEEDVEDEEYEDDEEEYEDDDESDESDEYEDDEEEIPMEHGDMDMEMEDDIPEVLDSLTDEQKDAVYYVLGAALEENGMPDEYDDYEEGEEEDMKHNVFAGDTAENTLTHADMDVIFSDAKRIGSLRDAVEENIETGVLAHAVTNNDGSAQKYGIADINWLFPDARNYTTTPEFIQRDNGWVAKVMSGAHNSPFSRVKSVFANITMEEARAKGYIKAHEKVDEVFSLLKRTTDPQTIYKKQKLDRDDVVDITDFDVVAWIKGEMRMMLDEEIARAILIGDGRTGASDDKISADHIRPIATDAALYTVPVSVSVASTATDDDKAKAFIKAAIKNRKLYKGSGSPTLYTTEDMLADMLLLEDTIGHVLYDDVATLCRKLRVNDIVTVPVMEGNEIFGILVNLADYNVGADKGGEVNLFDDFDIDYNQMKYLIETRCSGALVKPYSAMAFKFAVAQG